jgi:hypothetical protein
MVSQDFRQKLVNRWNERVVNNSNITSLMKYQLSQISNQDVIRISKQADIDYFNTKYPDQKNHIYLTEGSRLMQTLSPGLSIDVIKKYQNDIGITGTARTFDFRSESESLVIETIIHDILSIYALTGKAPGILGAVYHFDGIETSAALVPIYAIKEGLNEPTTIESIFQYKTNSVSGLIGAAIGGQIASMSADDDFASQLIAKSLGEYSGGLALNAIAYEFNLSDQPLSQILHHSQ